MKKNILILLLTFIVYSIKAQSPQKEEGKSHIGNINEMFSGAPTSNNLMKFEEVPIGYYTGIPDINIPLFNLPTNNKNVSLNIQLKYHPLSVKPDDRSGETGLGWSLIAGGTITRTVRGGNPDEKDRTIAFSSPPKVKFGIYNQTYNPTYKILNNDTSFNFSEYTFDAGIGKFDTEYDLYQYNFMDKSGRFYIVKDANGNYTAEKLDKNNHQIICNKDITTGVINSFTIIDDKGIRYIFDAMERSHKDISKIKIGLTTGIGEFNPDIEIGDFYTSFHLTKINDQNDINLVDFKYNLSSLVKFQETPMTTTRIAKNVHYTNNSDTPKTNPDNSMPGAFEQQTVYNTSLTYLLTNIDIKGRGSLVLNYEQGRLDSNYTDPTSLYKLKSLQVNYVGETPSQHIDKYILDYDYTNVNFQINIGNQLLKKMLLKKVTKVLPNNQNSEYVLEYNKSSSILKKDDWGYYKALEPNVDNAIVTDIIKSITYPTKGKVIYNFDENEYSYHPIENNTMAPVTGYNIIHNSESSINFSQFSNTYKQPFFTIQSAQTVNLNLFLGNLIYFNWQFKLYKKNADNTFSPAIYEFGYPAQTCNKVQPPDCMILNPNPNGEIISEFTKNIDLEPGIYFASLSGDFGPSNPSQTDASFIAYTTESTYVDKKVYKGAGVRIKDISYFENPSSDILSKKFIYTYTNLDDPNRSSGALVFLKPLYKITDSYTYKNKFSNANILYSADFDITTDYNILPVQKTQGSDVGYKYVSVEQLSANNSKKGKTVYKFRSPIDYPNQAIIIPQLYPIPIPNQDYLRGQLVSERKYDSDNKLVSETTTDHISLEYEKNDGVKIKDNFSNNMISELYSFFNYQEMIDKIGMGIEITSPYKNFEKFGITLPKEKNETSYLYKNGIMSSVSSRTTYVHNNRDYITLQNQLFQDGAQNKTTYQYAHEKGNQKLINANMIGIPLQTTTTKDGKVIANVETKYDDPANLLPTSVLSYDLQNPAVSKTELTYDLYDNKGNILQYSEKGKPVTIIWGYGQTQPIAKIEGATYNQISAYVAAIIAASDLDHTQGTDQSEQALISALDIFRNNPALSGYQISTYTYNPLIGVTSITPPSGIREIYKYDAANRLESVKDVNGNILKEYQYRYKN
ncbi:hypothetical protein BAX94_14930 [Elizabethkingia meningoseptica]|uniref:Sugar-binding protein n=5 Tax=Elizabethkingia meningoseptica TaxID=238 RepID=A0A1T3FCJ4_ELIME|nr:MULTISPECIES: RHS repeat domain-containing protein [Elizabethkingia]AQX11123.1 hypothetical protein BBD35_01445 [Elizabethkingia meningoseptica]MBG0512454.1 RHS repeat protein [Elizabethkingia meningoseptica]MDE5435816.1 RHS repeat protein [Elizabethkingia meningoseptica]MDE5449969.1 RHS repeat protein [Elizabethkingia meningoseptica]MDE5472841.1 RHS repeat protein [Elizabethkingia meningoseptica]